MTRKHSSNLCYAETHFLQFIYNKAEKTVMVRSAKAEFVLTRAEFKAHMWQLFMVEIPENLPFLFGKLERKSFERTNTLPDYGPHTPTRAEAYADRLRQEKWDIRKNGDPSCWRLASY